MEEPGAVGARRNFWSRGEEQQESPPDAVDSVLLYYLYRALPAPAETTQQQLAWCTELGLKGRVRVAEEGLNGTLDGSRAAVDEYIARMDQAFGPKGSIDWKIAAYPPDCSRRFKGISVKEVKEVISTDLPLQTREEIVASGPGKHLTAAEFHALLQLPDEEICLVDCRNFYETRVGRFVTASGALPLDPMTRSFSDFRHFVEDETNLKQLEGKKVLMYCTGGVRCERASAYLRARLKAAAASDDAADTTQVFQLFGGIQRYQEQFPDHSTSLFLGKNFVYDPRISVSSSEGAAIIGRCLGCTAACDDYSFQVRCHLCRVLVLACGDCRGREQPFTCELCEKRRGQACEVVKT